MEPKAQCRACLTYLDVGIVYCTCGHFLRDDTTENKKYIKSVLDLLLYPELLHQERPATRSQVREEKKVVKDTTRAQSTPKEVHKTKIQEHSRSIYP